MWKHLVSYANEDYVLYTLIDKTTGTEIDKCVLGKRYHWWILYVLAFASFLIRHCA